MPFKMGFGEGIRNWIRLLYINIISAGKDVSLRGVTIQGSGGLHVKASPYVDDFAVFYLALLSVQELMSICDRFELDSEAKVNQGKNEAMTDDLKVLGIWFRGARTHAKTWEERIAKVRQKLSFWEYSSLSIAGKNLAIRCEALSLLSSKMDRVRRDIMDKTLDKGWKNVPNATLILMANFVWGLNKQCVDPWSTDTKCHYVLRFYLFSVLQRMGLTG
eukprot:g31011.t1